MGITTTSSPKTGHSLSSRTRCWDCNKPSHAFRMDPNSGNPICADCASRKGLDLPIEQSDDEVGTISPPLRKKGSKKGA